MTHRKSSLQERRSARERSARYRSLELQRAIAVLMAEGKNAEAEALMKRSNAARRGTYRKAS